MKIIKKFKGLVDVDSNSNPFTTSLLVADRYGIDHDKLIDGIKSISENDEVKKGLMGNDMRPEACRCVNDDGLVVSAYTITGLQLFVVLDLVVGIDVLSDMTDKRFNSFMVEFLAKSNEQINAIQAEIDEVEAGNDEHYNNRMKGLRNIVSNF